jgi:TonB-dependent receptor
MEELVVPGELDKASEVGLLTERQEATAVMDMIGQDFIARLGASTAGDALKRVTGTTVVDGKYVSVRGLSDRYVNTLLNGGRLPSTDPDKRSVNVDLFPGSSLESINVIKTFTPDQAGDFTGGSVDLRTRNFPDKPSFGASATVEYNSQATFNPNFLTYQGGGTGPFGFRADQRAIPQSAIDFDGFDSLPAATTFPAGLNTAQGINEQMRAFNPVVGLKTKTVGPNYKLNLQGGDVVEFENERKFGLFGAFSYNHEFSAYANGTRTQIFEDPNLQELRAFSYDQANGTEDVLWGTLLNLSGQLSADHTVSMNLLYNIQASDSSTFLQTPGEGPDLNQGSVIDYGERRLAFLQVSGQSRFPDAGHLRLDWNGGLGRANLDEPDVRAFQSRYDTVTGIYAPIDSSEDPVFSGGNFNTSTGSFFSPLLRYQRSLVENNYYTIADFIVPMDLKDQEDNFFKTGFYLDNAQRQYNQASFAYQFGGNGFYNSAPNIPGQTWADYYLSPDRSGEQPFVPGPDAPILSWYPYNTARDAGTFYNASQQVIASYVMANLRLFPQLTLTGGARFENTNLNVESALPDGAEIPSPVEPGGFLTDPNGLIQQLDLLPAVAATFELMENVNLRFAWSQTLARPSFKEMGPIVTQEFGDSSFFVGNPQLGLSTVNNYDFRAEWYVRPGEILSVGLFYKDIDQPIEQTTFGNATDGTFLSYINTVRGQVWGWEIELRKRLDQLTPVLKDFSVFFNFTQIQSQATMSEQEVNVRTEAGVPGDTRPLQGQPQYVLNSGLNFDKPEYRFYAGLYFNVSGEFLYAAGGGTSSADFVPDAYEQPFPSLDFNLTQGLTEQWKMTLRGKNLLNPFYRITSTYQGVEYDTLTYTKGWDLSLNVSYSF